jgi:hypothetical protein
MAADARKSYREVLVEKHHQATLDFDRAVFVLAGGALGLSITFIHDIAPDPTHKAWLSVAWGSFALALLSTFVSYLTSQGVLLRRIDDIDKGRAHERSWYGYVTTGLNLCAALFVFVGFVCLVRFALYNL